MTSWTEWLLNFQPLQVSDDNIESYQVTLPARRCLLRRQTFHSQSAAEQQRHKESLAFAHSHRNIVESLQVTVEAEGKAWHVYVPAPYMSPLEEDVQRRNRDGELYSEQQLKGYLQELVAALAYLQSKVGLQAGHFPPQHLPQGTLLQH